MTINIINNIEISRFFIDEWGKNNIRIYPWRNTSNPYIILYSELMLKRTRADNVLSVYYNFFDKYPNVYTLASSNVDAIRSSLFQIGLFRRADEFKSSAKYITDKCGGYIPKTYDELIKIKGVGQYTAGMMLICAYGEPSAPIDSNFQRFFSRLLLMDLGADIHSQRELRELSHLYFLDNTRRLAAYHLLDFCAKICTHYSPSCATCPLSHYKCCKFGQKLLDKITN